MGLLCLSASLRALLWQKHSLRSTVRNKNLDWSACPIHQCHELLPLTQLTPGLLEKPAVEISEQATQNSLSHQFSFYPNAWALSKVFCPTWTSIFLKSYTSTLHSGLKFSISLNFTHKKNFKIVIDNARPDCFSLLTLNHIRSFHILLASSTLPTLVTGFSVLAASGYFDLSKSSISLSYHLIHQSFILPSLIIYSLFIFFDSALYLWYGTVHIWTSYKIICIYMSSFSRL